MRLEKGDKVEVMNKNEVPVSWRSAEILSDNGHTYHLQYDSYAGASQLKTETVSRNSVRPCQPVVQGVEDFMVGDIVEVFYECAWRTAAVLKVLQNKGQTKSMKISLQAAAIHNRYYLVRLLGENSAETIVDGSKIRTKHTWHDGKWILFEKSSRGAEDVTASKPSTSICHQSMNFKIPRTNARAKKTTQKNGVNILDESPHHDSRLLKRMCPYASSMNEAHEGRTQKLRAIEKDGRKQGQAVTPAFEKVDDFSYPREVFSERSMHVSHKVLPTGYNQMARVKVNDVSGIRDSALNSSESDASSVGSCSITDWRPDNLDMPSTRLLTRETDAACSDAESGCGSSSKRIINSLPPEEEVEISIRRLELQAYRRTLEALYASGPLSWDQESMLTNLRIMLHISNDEHLTELKYLISAKTSGQVGGMLDLIPSLKLMTQFAASHLALSFWTIQSSTFELMTTHVLWHRSTIILPKFHGLSGSFIVG